MIGAGSTPDAIVSVQGAWFASREASEPRGQGVALGVLDRVEREIDVKLWPMQMTGRWPLEPQDRVDWGALEPREFVEGNEQLAIVDEHPEAVLGDVRDFSCRSGAARHLYLLLVVDDQL